MAGGLLVAALPPVARAAALNGALQEFGCGARVRFARGEFSIEAAGGRRPLPPSLLAEVEALVLAVVQYRAADAWLDGTPGVHAEMAAAGYAVCQVRAHSVRLDWASQREAAREAAYAATAALRAAGVELGRVALVASRF